MSTPKTNAMRMLDKEKIPYQMHTYDASDRHIDGAAVARKVGMDPAKVFKTLVTRGHSGSYYVCVLPVERELDLKKAAKVFGEKSLEMIPVAQLLPTTGYVRGGCSPIGMKKRFATVFDELAKEQKIIAADPTEGCALPKLEHKEMQTLPVEQLASFLREAKESGVFELYYVELATGLRKGELLGLKWEDIDLEKGNLRVKRQIARINGEVVEAPLKTKNAYRMLPLAEDTIAVLKEQKKKAGGSPWVFPSPTGGPISPDSVLHMLHRVLKRAGLPRVRFHDLRHTFATLALQNRVAVKTVSGMLGHFSAGFTLDTYAHVTTATQKEAARTMEKVLTAAL